MANVMSFTHKNNYNECGYNSQAIKYRLLEGRYDEGTKGNEAVNQPTRVKRQYEWIFIVAIHIYNIQFLVLSLSLAFTCVYKR